MDFGLETPNLGIGDAKGEAQRKDLGDKNARFGVVEAKQEVQ